LNGGTLFALLAVAVLLVACGGGGSAPPTATVQTFGDSTQVLAFPYWQKLLGNRVTLRAVNGTGTRALLLGQDCLNGPWPQDFKADWAVINHGLNDGGIGAAAITLDEYRDNLRKLVAAGHGRVILETPNPSTQVERANMGAYAQVMRDVAAETHAPLIDVHARMQQRPDWPGLLSDGAHPTPEGLEFIVNEIVAPRLRDLGLL
jgi:lysophospholipase L1-like esterase